MDDVRLIISRLALIITISLIIQCNLRIMDIIMLGTI